MSQDYSSEMNAGITNRETQETSHSDDISAILDIVTAHNFVILGKIDEAECILSKKGELPSSNEALDLLARIAVQKGQYRKAKKLWNAILEKDPTNGNAKAAIKTLNSQWLAIALIKRVAILICIAVILSFSVIGLFSLIKNEQQPQREQVDQLVSVPGASVSYIQNETKIVFDEGLFRYRCELSESAQKRIATLGKIMRDKSPSIRIIIEGHADSYALRKDSPYKNNYELGLQRAIIVAEILKDHHYIEGSRILVTSMGDTRPPFPEKDHQSKLRNRTVVFRLL